MTTHTLRKTRPSHLAVVDTPITTDKSTKYSGQTIAVWSGSGAPGRSTIAINLASELVLTGNKVLLVDLDTLSPSIALFLGLTETPAGLSAVLRLVDQDRLTRSDFSRLTVALDLGKSELIFLPGLSSPARWEEVTSERVEKFLDQIASQFDYVVLDLAQACYPAGRLAHPALASNTDRDSLLRSVLAKCAVLVTVSGSDPVAAKRFLQAQELLVEIDRTQDQLVVVNRFRNTTLGSSAEAELEQTYLSLAKVRIDVFVPDEPADSDRALRNGLPLALIKRSSPARVAIRELAEQIKISSANSKRRG